MMVYNLTKKKLKDIKIHCVSRIYINGEETRYLIHSHGYVISTSYNGKEGDVRFLKHNHDADGYCIITLNHHGKKYTRKIHRLVAEAFIPNPNNLPEVNHKNKDRADNRVENLEWCDRISNLYDSYSTMSPIRNFRECRLLKEDTNEIIETFQSIVAAARYASEKFGCSKSGMERNHKSKGYKIEYLESVTTKMD